MDRFWKINQTLLQKLRDTSYQVSDADWEACRSAADFVARYPNREALNRSYLPLPDTLASLRTPNGVLLCFAELDGDKKQIGIEEVRHLIKKMDETGTSTAFFILNATLSPKANETLQNSQAPGMLRVVVFQESELLFNVTAHARVPKHELLPPSSAAQWLQESGLKRSQIPRMLETDPCCKYYDCLPNDILRITRPSPTSGSFVHHVMVVKRLEKSKKKTKKKVG